MGGNSANTIDYYTLRAKNYNLIHPDVDENVKPHFDKLISMLKENAKILFVGFGNGAEVDYFFKKGFTNVKGMDISKGQVELARKLYPHLKDKLGVGDALKLLDLKDLKFDLITYNASLAHFTDKESLKQVLTDTSELLEDKGLVYLRVVSKTKNGKTLPTDIDMNGRTFTYYTLEELKQLSQSLGYEVEEEMSFNHELHDRMLESENIELTWPTLILRKN